MRSLAIAWVLAGLAGVAQASDPPKAVVRPFAGDDDLAIYGKPVADEVAAGLSHAGVKSEVVLGEAPPTAFVVELRALKAKKLVRLEATVTSSGSPVAQASAKPVKVAQLAQAASQLAKQLAPKMLAAPKPAPAPAPAPASAPAPAPPPESDRIPVPVPVPESPSSRPLVLLSAPEGRISGQTLRRLGIGPMRFVLEHAGYRVAEAKEAGMLPPEVAGRSAHQAGAHAIVMVQLISANIAKNIVLYGRGRIQVVAVRDDGWVLFNRVVDTDTVVGGKTDGHDALVGFMMRQALEIVGRDLGRALKP